MVDHQRYIKSLPQKPGVYLYHNEAHAVIYVGKAIKLRSRVSSYFRPKANLSAAKQIMLDEIARIEHILVRSETEALLLESTLIKKYRPKYNVILKDDKFFQYIKIALRDRFPQVSTVRRVTIDGSRYFGPYTSGLAVRRTMRLLKRLFPYKSCNNKPEIPCFDSHLGRCLGHDVGPGSEQRYQSVVRRLIDFLEGKTGDTLKNLRRDMQTAASKRDFETAALLRDRWQALEHVIEQQTVVTPRRDSFDVVSFARRDDIAAVNLFQIRQGKLVQRDQFMLQHVLDQTDADVIAAFITQYYSQSTVHPKHLYVPVELPANTGNALQLRIERAQRGLKRKLLLMGQENAADFLEREQGKWLSAEAKARLGLQELAHALQLDGPPQRIEMYDISNFQGQHAVGSMVVFEHGVPKKSDYRKFTIKNTKIPDDMHRLAEVLQRRFARHDESGWPLPNLIILDGGKPQLSVVLRNVPGLLQHVPVVALAKVEEELFIPGRPTSLKLPVDSQELFLIQNIRDEAHRFAIGFYRHKHRRETTRSRLDEIPGLGDDTRRTLLRHFGTLRQIQAASHEEIVAAIGKRKAELLESHL
ncbi:MAG: excinuclease ABC subunit UvrC [Candidatus Kerfeldbacteria bacterium]|nr:excinuclease ABC subunit UvrC [Candidatus Kerfeldbacteria bacterium]